MIFAQITDCHVMADPDHPHNRQLRTVVGQINGIQEEPRFVLASGDLTNDGEADQFQQLGEILGALDMPLYVIPGNHDDREPLLALFRDKGYLPTEPPFMHYAINHHPVRVIALDTKEEGEHFGRLCEKRLRWLSIRLAEEREQPTVIVMHHPPFETGIQIMDVDRCLDGPAFAAIVAKSHNIERILCGHVHRPGFTRFAGTIASICPSTAFHLEPAILVEQKDYLVTREPPAFQLHVWAGEAGLVSHTIQVDMGDHT
jgi:3',5'-cyclic-AMP phosphodiesterase